MDVLKDNLEEYIDRVKAIIMALNTMTNNITIDTPIYKELMPKFVWMTDDMSDEETKDLRIFTLQRLSIAHIKNLVLELESGIEKIGEAYSKKYGYK